MKLEEALYQFVQWQSRGTSVLYWPGEKTGSFLCRVDEVGRDFLLLNRTETDQIFLIGSVDEAQLQNVKDSLPGQRSNVISGVRFIWSNGQSCCLLEMTGACSLVDDSGREGFLSL